MWPLLVGYGIREQYGFVEIEAVAAFLVSFGAHVNVLDIIHVKMLVLFEWSQKLPLIIK